LLYLINEGEIKINLDKSMNFFERLISRKGKERINELHPDSMPEEIPKISEKDPGLPEEEQIDPGLPEEVEKKEE